MQSLTPFEPMTAVIRARRRKALERAETRELAGSVLWTALILVAFAAAFQMFFGLRIVHGGNMFPALRDGDLTLCYRDRELVKNDVVFYTAEGRTRIGRVAAKGGDTVEITPEGVLRVNGTPQTGEIVYPTYPPPGWLGVLRVPEGSVFLLADYRMDAEDSRTLGCIPLEAVEAKIIAVIRHRGI